MLSREKVGRALELELEVLRKSGRREPHILSFMPEASTTSPEGNRTLVLFGVGITCPNLA